MEDHMREIRAPEDLSWWKVLLMLAAIVLLLATCVTTRSEEERAICMVECVRGRERPPAWKVEWCKWSCGY